MTKFKVGDSVKIKNIDNIWEKIKYMINGVYKIQSVNTEDPNNCYYIINGYRFYEDEIEEYIELSKIIRWDKDGRYTEIPSNYEGYYYISDLGTIEYSEVVISDYFLVTWAEYRFKKKNMYRTREAASRAYNKLMQN